VEEEVGGREEVGRALMGEEVAEEGWLFVEVDDCCWK